MKEQFTTWLNRILVADVFFVFIAFGWFAIAVIGKSTGISLGWDLWMKLWQPVFNPALGLLMAGAIISGLLNWITKRFNPDT